MKDLGDAGTKISNAAMWRIAWTDLGGLPARSPLWKRADLPGPGAEITVHADPAGKVPSVWEGDRATG